MTNHTLKISRAWWYKLSDGTKTAELRRNDSDFQAGDSITFDVTDEAGNSLGWRTGYADRWTITHVMPLYLFVPGDERTARWVMLSLKAPDADYYRDRCVTLEYERDRWRRRAAAYLGHLNRLRKGKP